jgi:hypothetical protein
LNLAAAHTRAAIGFRRHDRIRAIEIAFARRYIELAIVARLSGLAIGAVVVEAYVTR